VKVGATWVPMNAGDLLAGYDESFHLHNKKALHGLVFSIWAVPESGTPSKVVFNGAIVNKINKTIVYPYYARTIAPSSMWNGMDNRPGSAGGIDAIAGASITFGLDTGKINRAFRLLCFVPTISASAVDVSEKNFNYLVNTDPDLKVRAKRYITQDDLASPPADNLRNGTHTAFTPHSVKIFENEMLNTAPATIPSGKTYNYGAPVSDWVGDVTVNGTLAINKNVKAGYTDDNYHNNEPPEGSTYFVETFIHDNNCTSDPVTITVNGELQLGDAGTDRHGGLTINSGSRLILNPGASLKIYKNSKLTIKPGATLELNGGTITLQDDGSNLEMGGYLELDNYDLTFTGSGFITIISQSSGYASISKTGGCSIQIEGSSKTDLKLRVIGGGIDASGFNQVELKNGLVEMGEDAEIKTSSSTHLESVKFAPLPWATSDKFQGVTFDGQNGNSITVKFCEFGNAKIALNKLSSADVTLLEIRGCKFTDCEKAIVTEGYRVYLNNNQFTNCDYAWYATEMEGLSQFKGRILGSSQKGIYYNGGTNAHLLIEQSLFSENGSAVEVFGTLQATISCSEFEDNNASVLAGSGVTLNLSAATNGSNAAGTTNVAGGNNRFTNVADYDIGLSDAFDLLTLDGNNTLYYPNYSSSPASYSIGGNVTNSSYHALHLASNYWYFYGYSPTYSIPSGMYSLYFGTTLIGTTGAERSTSISYSCGAVTETDVNNEVFYGKREEPNSDQKIIENKEYRIYPNPAKQLVNISSDLITKESVGNFDIKIVDVTGRIIELHKIKQEGMNIISCETSQLTPGVYMLVIFKDGMLVQKRKLIIKG
ncbi:MAG: T9SS type A sorting domain-containing protein, partial [Bacteroidia bacterium]|nr:T9SS type A sorting domain-containing protein [Bacteroidia bacterium]